MIHDFIKMIDNVDFLYGFIYKCANLINNLYNYNNYDHLAIKSQNEYLEIKKFIDNNIDIIESALAPMNDYFDLCKKCYSHYYCSCYYYHKKKVYVFFLRIDIKNFMKKL